MSGRPLKPPKVQLVGEKERVDPEPFHKPELLQQLLSSWVPRMYPHADCAWGEWWKEEGGLVGA